MRFKKDDSRYFLKLERGEDVLEALLRFAGETGVVSGSLTGIGAVADPVIGYYDLARKAYLRHELRGEYEVVSLTGSLSESEGRPMPHLHVVLSGPDGAARAGHLFSARVSLTLEAAFQSYPWPLVRKPDPDTGLKLLDLP
ncbi:MAG: hypothetical protein A2X36_16630 [Elusimicrobia bacterium GWA2_69_24]|nr:MAG: hypothetical protein A2X36_16630 [Elusimicrobia bacterium GWA2_69_24]HBL16657.1 DUF296 domain-containing protein [Elusimicrobiota bacterium]